MPYFFGCRDSLPRSMGFSNVARRLQMPRAVCSPGTNGSNSGSRCNCREALASPAGGTDETARSPTPLRRSNASGESGAEEATGLFKSGGGSVLTMFSNSGERSRLANSRKCSRRPAVETSPGQLLALAVTRNAMASPRLQRIHYGLTGKRKHQKRRALVIFVDHVHIGWDRDLHLEREQVARTNAVTRRKRLFQTIPLLIEGGIDAVLVGGRHGKRGIRRRGSRRGSAAACP